MPSVVEDVIGNGKKSASKHNTTMSYSDDNNIGVVTDNETGSVISVGRGMGRNY